MISYVHQIILMDTWQINWSQIGETRVCTIFSDIVAIFPSLAAWAKLCRTGLSIRWTPHSSSASERLRPPLAATLSAGATDSTSEPLVRLNHHYAIYLVFVTSHFYFLIEGNGQIMGAADVLTAYYVFALKLCCSGGPFTECSNGPKRTSQIFCISMWSVRFYTVSPCAEK